LRWRSGRACLNRKGTTLTGTPIVLQCGADFWIQFVHTDATTGAAVPLSSPKMEVRAPVYGLPQSQGQLLYSSEAVPATIAITQPSSNTVLATIPGTATANLTDRQIAAWDCYATEVDTGKVVLLGSGSFLADPNVTKL
jgi:hypothetical protein